MDKLLAVLLLLMCALPAGAQPQGRGGPGGRGFGPAGRGGGMPPPMPRDSASDQPIATGTGVSSGSVVVLGTGQPARRARVTLNAADGGGSRTAMTDEQGRYAFNNLAPGRYTLSASKTGHIGVSFGAARPGRPGTP